MLAAGFYYKTFMWPPGFWRHVYEPLIRHAAGLGRAPTLPDPDRYLHRYAHCDVLVIGSGPAGMAAALAAAETGARVILCDEQAELGGSLLAESAAIEGQPATGVAGGDARRAARQRSRAAAAAHDGVRLVRRQSARPRRARHRPHGRAG